jgi:pimeloyl-ACP methyl ester carboxylesterase
MRKLLLVILSFLFVGSGYGQNAIRFTQLSAKGSPIIFLPHIGCSSEMWKQIADHYQKTNTVYLADFAGFNGESPIKSSFSDAYAKDLQKFIKTKKLKNVTLVGQNYGAFVAVKTAADQSLSIQSIIASDFYPKLSMVLSSSITPEQLAQMTSGIRKGTLEMGTEAFAASQKQTAEMMNFTKNEDVNRFVQWQLKSDRNTLAETLCEQFSTDLRPLLQEHKIPMLVYTTWFFAKTYKNMPITAANEKLREMYGETPLLTHAITADAKDFMANDQPEWFIGQMDKFLKQTAIGK